MKQIEEFLSRFKIIEDPKKDLVKIVRIVSEVLKIEIEEVSVSLKDNIVTFNLPPTIKSYIFTKNQKIIEEIEKTNLKKDLKIRFK